MRPSAALVSAFRTGLIVVAALQAAPLPAQTPAGKAKAIGPKPDDPRGKEAKPAAKQVPAKR